MAKYYNRIYLERMAKLLDLSVKESEEFLCQLVMSGTVVANINQLEGVVNFGITPDHSERLNNWSDNLNHITALVNKTTHLINKEMMVHRHLLPAKECKSEEICEEIPEESKKGSEGTQRQCRH